MVHLGFSDGCNTFDDRHHVTRDGEMDSSEIIFRKQVGPECGHSNTDDVELGSPKNDGIDKAEQMVAL